MQPAIRYRLQVWTLPFHAPLSLVLSAHALVALAVLLRLAPLPIALARLLFAPGVLLRLVHARCVSLPPVLPVLSTALRTTPEFAWLRSRHAGCRLQPCASMSHVRRAQ